MSSPSPFGDSNPFASLFGEMARLLSSAGPVNWDVGRQVARWLASGGQPEANVDPVERIRLEELARVADLHVAEASGLATSASGLLIVRSVTRSDWAARTLEVWKPRLEALSRSLSGSEGTGTATTATEEPPASGEPLPANPVEEGLVGEWARWLNPLVLGLQAGSMVGNLALRSLGQYDLPIPRPDTDELLVVPANINAFAADWSLPLDDVRLWVCVNEVAHHAVLTRPHVRAQLEDLLGEYVGGFHPDPDALGERMTNLDLNDPAAIQQAFGDPDALLGEIQTPAQRELLPRLAALTAAIEGWVDRLVDVVGHRLIASYGPLSEALRRRRLDRGEGDRLVERLFGLELSQEVYDRGAAFIQGVVEREGEAGLSGLWSSAWTLPTPAEVDAPGLWLARIALPGGTA